MFRKVGAPEFRKEGGREKKEKIVESKKKTSTTPVESRSSYNTGIGDRRSYYFTVDLEYTVHDVEKYAPVLAGTTPYRPIIDLRVV